MGEFWEVQGSSISCDYVFGESLIDLSKLISVIKELEKLLAYAC